MKFTNDANINGTSFKGSVVTTYAELVQVFGLPDDGPDVDLDKVTCCWRLQFEDGTVASIYDWKTGATPYDKYEWHIGGKTSTAVDHVLEVFYAVHAQ